MANDQNSNTKDHKENHASKHEDAKKRESVEKKTEQVADYGGKATESDKS